MYCVMYGVMCGVMYGVMHGVMYGVILKTKTHKRPMGLGALLNNQLNHGPKFQK